LYALLSLKAGMLSKRASDIASNGSQEISLPMPRENSTAKIARPKAYKMHMCPAQKRINSGSGKFEAAPAHHEAILNNDGSQEIHLPNHAGKMFDHLRQIKGNPFRQNTWIFLKKTMCLAHAAPGKLPRNQSHTELYPFRSRNLRSK